MFIRAQSLLLLVLVAFTPSAGLAARAGKVAVWLTTADQRHLLSRQQDVRFGAKADANVRIDPRRKYQAMVGFGAAMTDASAINIRQRLTASARDRLMRELFGAGPGQLNFSFMRVGIGAPDFAPRHYTFDDMPPGEEDPDLRHFSIDPIRADILPLLKQARAINPALKILASPFSAPAWMKANGHLYGGSLRRDRYAVYADYFIRYLDAMQAEGVKIDYLTVQNEPLFEPKNYPGMAWPAADRADFYARHLGPRLAARRDAPGLLDFDHNWDLSQSPMELLARPDAARHVLGVAWHCYGGDVAAQGRVHDAFPEKQAFFTECSGGGWAPVWADNMINTMRRLIIGSTRNWARGVLMWNIALDEKDGPHTGGCPNCTGIVTIDSRTGAVTRNLEYYAFGHASRFIRQGARRIESTDQVDGLDTVAFRNPDGGLVLLVLNSNDKPERLVAEVRLGRERGGFSYEMPARSTATVTWHP